MNKGHGVAKVGSECVIKQQQQKTELPSKMIKIITLEQYSFYLEFWQPRYIEFTF